MHDNILYYQEILKLRRYNIVIYNRNNDQVSIIIHNSGGFFSYFGSESLLRPIITLVQDVNPVLNYFYSNEVAKAAGLSRMYTFKSSQHIKDSVRRKQLQIIQLQN